MVFYPMCLDSKDSDFSGKTQQWMKTILDQISIPSLCRHVAEMAHTLVGKQCLYDGMVSGSTPNAHNFAASRQGVRQNGNFLFFVFVAFLCFDFVPFVGTPENAGVM